MRGKNSSHYMKMTAIVTMMVDLSQNLFILEFS